MARDGQFLSYDEQKVTVQTTKGPWSMFYPKSMAGQLAQFQPHQMVQFECSKPEGKNYWRLDSIHAANGAQAHAAPAPVGQYVPPPAQQMQAPLPPAPTYQPPEDPKAEEIFVTGIVGRAMQSGNFSIEEIPALTNAAVRAWRGRAAT